MDFFARQERARKLTRWLLLWYGLAVLGIVLAVHAVIRLAIGLGGESTSDSYFGDPLLPIVAGVVLLLIAGSTLLKSLQLGKGGPAIAAMLGGRRVVQGTSDLRERRLVNVVEEMAIASGVPVPAVYVLDAEAGINAFAAGLSTENAVVAVTRGALDQLKRDELQGVIGHEFSHILNGDMRLNVRLVGILAGITTIATIGYWLIRTSPRAFNQRKGAAAGGGMIAIGLGLLAVGSLGALFARMIQAAISRHRERLADASAVQFTRDPQGLAHALLRIRSASAGSRIGDAHASELAHFFFAGGTRFSLRGLLATHPSLEERVQALLPGTRLEPRSSGPAAPPTEEELRLERAVLGDPGVKQKIAMSGLAPDELVASVGTATPENLDHGRALLRSLDEAVLRAVHDAFSARSVVCALLLDARADVAARQEAAIESALGPLVARESKHLRTLLAGGDARVRLPLLDLALPALSELSAAQRDAFRTLVDELVAADGEVSTFELALQKTLLRRLAQRGPEDRADTHGHRPLRALTEEAAILLAALAYAGTKDPALAAAAFARGATRLVAQVKLELPPLAACHRKDLQRAITAFLVAAPDAKRVLLLACADVAAADGRLSATEMEIVRAIADALECPVPL